MGIQYDSLQFVVRERRKFYTGIKRNEEESIQELASRIRMHAASCDFPAIKDRLDEALRTCFVSAVNNEAILKSVFHKSSEELSFNDVVDIALQAEEASKTAREQVIPKEAEVYKVKRSLFVNILYLSILDYAEIVENQATCEMIANLGTLCAIIE